MESIRPLVIIESPFAGDIEKNRAYLAACLRDSLMRGESPFASHAIYTLPGVLDDAISSERELGMKAGWDFMARAQMVAVYADLGISDGMHRGIAHATGLGLRIDERSLGGKWSRPF